MTNLTEVFGLNFVPEPCTGCEKLRAELNYRENKEIEQLKKLEGQGEVLAQLHEKLLPWRQTQTIDSNFDLITSLDKLIAEVWNYRRNNTNTAKSIYTVRLDG